MSPTQRSLEYLREQGWICAIVEKWNPYAKVRQDVFQFGDILAMYPQPEYKQDSRMIALVQTTTGANMAARRTKILGLTEFQEWKNAGGIVLLHGWRKVGARGKRKKWEVNEERL